MTIKKLLGCILLLLVTACGYQSGANQRQEQSFVRFIGNLDNAVVLFDDNASTLSLDSGTAKFAISPGKHRVKVVRNGQTVVDRVLFLGDEATMEVNVP